MKKERIEGRTPGAKHGRPEEGSAAVKKVGSAGRGLFGEADVSAEIDEEFDLRKAVIYAEILTPKFEEE